MKILIACEFSGVVREAFMKKGHDAWSCDFQESLIPGNHIKGDVTKILDNGWDIMIAHPPCTYLCSSGARWWAKRQKEQEASIKFVNRLINCGIPRIAIENPIGKLSIALKKPDQIIHPWQFGHGETKATCLWLFNLPKLQSTNIVSGREARIHKLGPSKNRSNLRSITYQGIADVMAEQWG